MSNPNIGVLAGFQCPRCNSYSPFAIECKTQALFTDTGADLHEDFEFEPMSPCRCMQCNATGRVQEFRKED